MEKEKIRLYYDTVYKFQALASSANGAWMLIRDKCHEQKLPVPTIDQIVLADKIIRP